MKKAKRPAWYVVTAIAACALWVLTMLIYWFNLDNKAIYYLVRPMLNKLYNKQKRDVKL
jgi:hypothetical protein